MADVRSTWMPIYRSALQWHGLLDLVKQRLAPSSLRALLEPTSEYVDVQVVAEVLQAVAAIRGLETVRGVGRHAMRLGLEGPLAAWVAPLSTQKGLTPAPVFAEMARLHAAIHRDGGEVRCVATERYAATTELVGFRPLDPCWIEGWLGAHEGLLRHFRFSGRATADVTALPRVLQVRTTWAGALSGNATALRPPVTPVEGERLSSTSLRTLKR